MYAVPSSLMNTEEKCTPCTLEKMSVCETMKKLYEVLIDIERETNRINGVIFGSINSDMCAGEPDSLESNAHMALSMANMILEELNRTRAGLIGG